MRQVYNLAELLNNVTQTCKLAGKYYYVII